MNNSNYTDIEMANGYINHLTSENVKLQSAIDCAKDDLEKILLYGHDKEAALVNKTLKSIDKILKGDT